MMRMRLLRGTLVLTCLVCLAFLSACTQSQQEEPFIKQKFDELSNDMKVLKGQIAEQGMELEVMDELVQDLRQRKPAANTADANALKGLEDRLLSMESSLKKIETRIATTEQKIVAKPKVEKTSANHEMTAVIAVPAALKRSAAEPRAPKRETARATGFYYTIKSGDTLSKISRQNNVPMEKIRVANRIPRGRNPLMGQKIFIPVAQ